MADFVEITFGATEMLNVKSLFFQVVLSLLEKDFMETNLVNFHGPFYIQ